MSNIAIWNGTSTYTTGSTPFGFYDSDATFRSEADQDPVSRSGAYRNPD